MMIDSEDLRKYINYIGLKDNDVMTKRAILYFIELVEEDVKNAERMRKDGAE